MTRRVRSLLLLVLFAGLSALAFLFDRRLPDVAGHARAIDGDSLRIGDAEIRLYGIDAPEHRQTCLRAGEPWSCGAQATRALQVALAGKNIVCRPRERDRYDRFVAVCEADGEDLAALMVRQGHAIAHGAYNAEEREARDARRGLWSSSFENPSAWRARHPRPLS